MLPGCRSIQCSASRADSAPSWRATISTTRSALVGRGGRGDQRAQVRTGLGAGDERAEHRVIAMQKDVLHEHLLLQGRWHGVELAPVGGTGSTVDLGVMLRVSPAQLGAQRVAGDVVGVQPPGAGLDDREAPQPVEHLVRVGEVQQLGQQRLGCGQHLGARLESPSVQRARHRLDQCREEGIDHASQLRRW